MELLGLGCVSSADARLLILGTIPGAESLRQQAYYSNRRNQFWRVLFAVLDETDPLEYERRLAVVKRHHIALWDVLEACDRVGSLDSTIAAGTEVVNDIPRFLRIHSSIRGVALNGAKASALFHRLVVPRLGDLSKRIRTLDLPSTSPANTSGVESKISRTSPPSCGRFD